MNLVLLFTCLISVIAYGVIYSYCEKIKNLKASNTTYISFKTGYLPYLFSMLFILLSIIIYFFYTPTYTTEIFTLTDGSFNFNTITESYSYLNLLFLIPLLRVIYLKNIVNKYAYFTTNFLIINGLKRNYDYIFNIEISKELDKNNEYSVYIHINILKRIRRYSVYIYKDEIDTFKEMIGDKCKIIYR